MHLHRYEKIWLLFGAGSLVLFLAVLGVAAFAYGMQPQSAIELCDPTELERTEDFKPENLGVTKVDEGRYVVNMVASAFNYDFGKDENGQPVKKIRIPKGSTVLFQATTKDVIHGFEIAGTNVNMMLEPGFVSRYETKLKNPGEYTIVCNEYCGVGHHLMYATLEVY